MIGPTRSGMPGRRASIHTKWGAPLLAGISLACATTPIVVDFEKTVGVLGGSAMELERVSISPRLYARGCVDVVIEPSGKVLVTVQQDGTSDWILGRITPRVISDSVAVVMAAVQAPLDALMAAFGIEKPPVPPPSDVHGCGDLFEED